MFGKKSNGKDIGKSYMFSYDNENKTIKKNFI